VLIKSEEALSLCQGWILCLVLMQNAA